MLTFKANQVGGITLGIVLAVVCRLTPAAAERWVVHSSENFRVVCSPSVDGASIAKEAERLREELIRKWVGDQMDPWGVPCKIVVHPTAASYLQAAGAGAKSTRGVSTICVEERKVTSARVDARSDSGNSNARSLGEDVLAHELTHVVAAVAFPDLVIPLWLDEGMAVQADVKEKQSRHESDFAEASRQGGRFALVELFADAPQLMNRPGALYGQSASLVSYLTKQASARELLPFAVKAQESGYDEALRSCFGIEGVVELERSWLVEARKDASGKSKIELVRDRKPRQ